MRRFILFLGLILLLTIPMAALAQYDYPSGPSMGGDESSNSGSGVTVGSSMPSMGDVGEVSIVDFAFRPMSVSVPAGSTLSWSNDGAAPHTVTSFDGAFDSGTIGPGGGYSTTFSDPGIYTYHCTIHPNMVGIVSVTGS